MISKLNWTDFLMIMIGLIGLYYWFLFKNKRKALAAFSNDRLSHMHFSQSLSNDLPELIEKPIDSSNEFSISLEKLGLQNKELNYVLKLFKTYIKNYPAIHLRRNRKKLIFIRQ